MLSEVNSPLCGVLITPNFVLSLNLQKYLTIIPTEEAFFLLYI